MPDSGISGTLHSYEEAVVKGSWGKWQHATLDDHDIIYMDRGALTADMESALDRKERQVMGHDHAATPRQWRKRKKLSPQGEGQQ